MFRAKSSDYATTVSTVTMGINNLYEPLALNQRKLYYNQLFRCLGRLSIYFMWWFAKFI